MPHAMAGISSVNGRGNWEPTLTRRTENLYLNTGELISIPLHSTLSGDMTFDSQFQPPRLPSDKGLPDARVGGHFLDFIKNGLEPSDNFSKELTLPSRDFFTAASQDEETLQQKRLQQEIARTEDLAILIDTAINAHERSLKFTASLNKELIQVLATGGVFMFYGIASFAHSGSVPMLFMAGAGLLLSSTGVAIYLQARATARKSTAAFESFVLATEAELGVTATQKI
jgi:hypothetical protein